MKNITKIILAIVSTMFLAIGATHAAGQLDTLGSSKINTFAETVMDGPSLPCGTIED